MGGSLYLIKDNLKCSTQNVSNGEESVWEFTNMHTFLPSQPNTLLKDSGLLDLSISDRLLQVNP